MEGDMALFEKGVAAHRKIFRVFAIIGMVLVGAFMVEAAFEVMELGRFSNDDQAARTLVATGGGFALVLLWFLSTFRKHKAIRLLENPSELKSYKLMLIGNTDQISAIWVRNEKGTNYELPLVVDSIEEGHRALAALLEHAPHIEAETAVRLM